MPSWFFPERNGTIRCLIAGAIIGLFAGGAQSLVAEENCCSRSFAVPPASMPQVRDQNWGDQIASAISSAFAAKGGGLRHCPLKLEEHDFRGGESLLGFIDKLSAATGAAPSGLSPQQMALYEMDYLIVSSVSVANKDFAATVKVLDHHHGQTVRSGTYSWSGEPTGFGPGFQAWVDATFNPLDDVIYDYEMKPQSCRITLEGNSPTMVQAGETVTVRLSEIFDHQSRPSQGWQRVYVKAEKGKILNGREKGEYRVFDVGDGNLSVTYKAPDACKSDKETLTVYNTCYTKNNSDGTPMDVAPDKEIAKKQFNIVCDQWDVKITYTEDLGGTYNPGATKITVKRSYSGTFKARVKLIKTSTTTATYESSDAEVQIHDNYNHHTAREECSWRGGFNGSKGGRAPVEVELRFNTHNHTYHVGLGKWSGDGASYTLGGNLFGTSQGCSGAWQQEISSIVLPRGWEKGEGPPSSRPWAPGQTSFTFQTSWDDYMTGIWPQGAVAPPPALSVMMPAAYRIVYHPLVYDWGKFPNMRFKKTLSWEIKRPK
jgi:hypothetical protein